MKQNSLSNILPNNVYVIILNISDNTSKLIAHSNGFESQRCFRHFNVQVS
jgi:hypothetical protein